MGIKHGEEKEKAYYQAAKYWELVGDWQAKDFYQRYLRTFKTENPAHAIEAQAKLIEIKRRIYPKEVELETRRLEALYDRLVSKGNRDPAVHKYGAYTKIRKMDEQFQKLRDFKHIQKGDIESFNKNLESIEENAKVLDGILQGFCSDLRKIPDLEALAASYYCEGQAIFLSLDFRVALPEPDAIDQLEEFLEDDSITEEQRERFEGILSNVDSALDRIAEGNDQLEELAYARLDKGLERAKEKQFWSPWHTKMKSLMHTRKSDEYPPDADEILFNEGSEVEDDLLPYSPRGGLYGSQLELSTESTDPAADPEESQDEGTPEEETKEEGDQETPENPEDISPEPENPEEDTPEDVPSEPTDNEDEEEEEE